MNMDQSFACTLRRLKRVSFLCALLNTEPWTLSTARAKDLGTHGVIYPIKEGDPIALIQQKLKTMEDSGELKRRNLELQKKVRASVERPKPVYGITKATKNRAFYFDPTYVAKENLYDPQGRVFAKKGMRINSLETISLSQTLIFFDGDDEERLAWVKERLANQPSSQNKQEKPVRLILTKGAPLTLAEDLGIPVYFDQSGILTTKLGIKHVPAMVTQEKHQLKIEEIRLPPSGELRAEGDV
jgi:conjugal transfer pilus assembly protein TraW